METSDLCSHTWTCKQGHFSAFQIVSCLLKPPGRVSQKCFPYLHPSLGQVSEGDDIGALTLSKVSEKQTLDVVFKMFLRTSTAHVRVPESKHGPIPDSRLCEDTPPVGWR